MTTPISLRIRKEWLVRLRDIKERDGTNVNNAINIAIQDYLARSYGCDAWWLSGFARALEDRRIREQ